MKSEDEKQVYTVQKVNDICPENDCSLKCHSCTNTCPHTFSSYTCIDSLLRGTVYKHVHQVLMLMAKMENKTGDHEVSFPSLIKDEDLQADN